VPEYATLARHLRNHFEQWFAFVFDPRIEPTNRRAEQAIRPAVVNRKVWGGNRTATGTQAQGVLMSVLGTCRRQAQFGRRERLASRGIGSPAPRS
jgi:transposase